VDLATPIQKIFMIGPIYARRLNRLEINTVEDLLYHFPHRYEDFSLISKIGLIQPGEVVTILSTVTQIKNEYTKNGKKIQKAVLSDGRNSIEAIWFNQPYLVRAFKTGQEYFFSGKADWFGRKIVFVSPEYEIRKGEEDPLPTIHTARLVPIYPETAGVSSKWLRSRISFLLKNCSNLLLEYLPNSIIEKYGLIGLKEAIWQIHFPSANRLAQVARERLSFDELFLIQLASLKRKEEWDKEVVGNKFKISDYKDEIKSFATSFPFTLTAAQKRAIGEILTDLAKTKPMNRLLEGDVGSGKTVVAAVAVYLAFLNGFKSMFMAPTEILAFQHYKTLKTFLEPLKMKVLLRTSQKKEVGDYDVLVGTHALLSEKKLAEKLGLVVIDEQHRFGVEQRASLRQKGINPHLLSMTATPIPRTVALTLYGELDLSFLDEMPLGRKRVKTWVVPPEKRQAAYEWIKRKVQGTREQAFIICPFIEESESLITIKAATKEYKNLKKAVFSQLRVGLLHGRMKAKEKDEILESFRRGNLDVLVATPVVEVGIDIPNATIMVIEGAERFGLAQLHQLRGRVGRADLASYCLLFSDEDKSSRLKAMEKIFIGASLAELDLKLRGPGEIYGTRQHGFANLKIASLSDFELVKKTKEAAIKVLSESPNLEKFPPLQQHLERFTIKTVSPD
jgi:ATP-dependent DNA helicase RecG